VWWAPVRGSTGPLKGTRSARKFRSHNLGTASRNHHHWKLLSPERRRAAVRHLQRVLGVSERFACRVAGQHRATQRHQAVSDTPADPDAGLRAWLRAYAKDHPRRGFRSACHDARAEGWIVNHKKIQRLWREEGLRVPQRWRRKRHGTSTAPLTVTADAPNRVWAVDFQLDVTTDGRPVKIVSIIDAHTRECLGGMVERSITGEELSPSWIGWPPSAAPTRRCCVVTTDPN
jgi:hypothetical protein